NSFLTRTKSLSATAARESWLSATITSGFTGKLRSAKHRSPTSGRSATAGPLSFSNTSTRSGSQETRERSKAPGTRFCLIHSFLRKCLEEYALDEADCTWSASTCDRTGWNVRRSIDARGSSARALGDCATAEQIKVNREGTVTQLTATRRTFL